MDLSVIIINWNSREYLRNCIRSIYRHLTNYSSEIIVLDNASYDGTGKMLRNSFPSVTFIQNTENNGFARANNRAFGHSSGDYLLFLNPDTKIHDRSIETMLQFLKTSDRAGIAGCKLIGGSGVLQLNSILSSPTIINQLFDLEILQKLYLRRLLKGIPPLFPKPDGPFEVDTVCGAALMIRRDIFAALGGFPTDYFMFSEDIDLCRRVRQQGFGVYVIPSAQIIHYGGQSSSKVEAGLFTVIQMKISRFIYFKKYHGPLYAKAYKAAIFIVALCRMTIILALLPVLKNRFTVSLRKWSSILAWSAGLPVRISGIRPQE
ncbi:MAG: glycosyltransferase [Chitinivibrionales bacterium]|nr:glycosyltransferase [Chitinivibrionales bacterium]